MQQFAPRSDGCQLWRYQEQHSYPSLVRCSSFVSPPKWMPEDGQKMPKLMSQLIENQLSKLKQECH